ncbi:MAG: membrane protein insertase YidC [Betaproteobacteria bacterium]|nr:MAG: membrane protein insertase YidC [Betaproteobacteria bacterium]
MDTQRLILFVIFSFSAFILWDRWQAEHRPPLPTSAPTAGKPSSDTPSAVPRATPAASAPNAPPASAPNAPGASVPAPAKGEKIEIKTDRYVADVDTLGGVITQVALTQHRDTDHPDKPYVLLQRNESRTFLAQSGLIGEGLPNHHTLWQALPGPRELGPGMDKLELKLAATTLAGATVTQTLTFHRGSYVIDVSYEVTNTGAAPITPTAYFQLARDSKPTGIQSWGAPSAYTGPVLYNETDKYKKLDFSDIDKGKAKFTDKTDNGWIGMVEHYFVAAWLPPDAAKLAREFYVNKVDNLYYAGVKVPVGSVAPGTTARASVPLYVGPQEQDTLKSLAAGLDLVVDYGIFTVIAAPLFWLLKWLHSLLGNWGWAIIAMTIIIKSAFYPLNHASARSMAKMKVVAPKMKALQEQYANDKQQLQMKMMELYKTEKINPLGGCLPIVVQIPVFIALYWVLLAAVELRHAPWIGWIHDLSAPDPYFVLPVVYAITAFLQVKLSPTPIQDPVQAKVMQIMPIAFSVLFLFFPSGLVLYWLINNSLQIFQQWHMNRVLEREAAAAAAKRR